MESHSGHTIFIESPIHYQIIRPYDVENPFTLTFQTGDAILLLKKADVGLSLSTTKEYIRGCIAIIGFEGSL